MYPEVEQYFAAIEAAEETFNTASRDGLSPHDESKCKYCARDVACEAAWGALRVSSDPLVRWIAENCEDYAGEAGVVLRALPASVDTLDTLAREHGWCGAWDGFRRQAEQAGVLPDAQTAVPAESEVSA